MSELASRLGAQYGRLGISTDADLIERRSKVTESIVSDLVLSDLVDLLFAIFGVSEGGSGDFLAHYRDDPTFDVQPRDTESCLLAAEICNAAMEDDAELAGKIALAIRSASVGGLRPPTFESDLLERADEVLASFQQQEASIPGRRNKSAAPAGLGEAITEIENITADHTHLSHLVPAIVQAIKEVQNYVGLASLADANGYNRLRGHIDRLERETRTQWWVAGGWSRIGTCSFSDLDLPLAVAFSATELDEQHESQLGLYAAPALLKMILERKRAMVGKISFEELAAGPKLDWRKDQYSTLANSDHAGLFPLSAALALSANAEDEEDWKGTFRRKTGLKAEVKMDGHAAAMQLYHEILTLNLLNE